jgi:glycosyltransferase involved in cell wall biosynthesis
MKVLNVNKFYYLKGGAETYYFSLTDLLEEHGMEVVPFSLKHERNFQTEYNRFFIEPVDFANLTLWEKFIWAGKIIYSFEARKKLEMLLDQGKPDVAHLHLIYHQISPSILQVFKKRNIPVVKTVHDVKLLCPNYKMLSGNIICEKCKGHKYINCLFNKCIKDSTMGSLVVTMEMYIHHWLSSYQKNVDIFITPSKFLMQMFIEYGYPAQKMRYLPNYMDASKIQPHYESGDYFLYLGRLSEEKGILTLIEAMKNLKEGKLIVAGTGPLETQIKEDVMASGLKNVDLVGFKTGAELEKLIAEAQFVVVPSICYENCPYSILEAYAFGKPVIGANIGGIPELITSGETGFFFESGNSVELAEKITQMLNHKEFLCEMGKAARLRVETNHGKEQHFQELEKIYQELLVSRA